MARLRASHLPLLLLCSVVACDAADEEVPSDTDGSIEPEGGSSGGRDTTPSPSSSSSAGPDTSGTSGSGAPSTETGGGSDESGGSSESGDVPVEPEWTPPDTSAGDPHFEHISNRLQGACDSPNPFGFGIGDWDRDGWPDIFVWDHGRERHCMWTNDGGAASFSNVGSWTDDTAPFFTGGWNVQLGDLDGDGDLDAIGRTTEGHDGWIENTTSGAGQSATAAFHGGPWGDRSRFTVADFDGDGLLEVGEAGPTIFAMDGSTVATFGDEESPLYFDIDGDSFVDAALPGGAVWLNDGDGNLAAAGEAPGLVGCSTSRSFIFDSNLDGDLDVFCYESDPVDRAWIVHNSGGTFVPGPDVEGFDYIVDVASKAGHSVADYNNDGRVDIFILGRQPNQVNVMLNRDGTVFERLDLGAVFDDAPVYEGYSGRPTSAPGDLDLDGRIDFVTMDSGPSGADPGTVSVLRNNSEEAGRYVQVVLDGTGMGAGGNGGAIGALVEALEPGSMVRVGTSYRTFRSYQQGVPDFAHLGTDVHETVDLRITWPGGFGVEVFEGVSSMARYRVEFAPGGSTLTAL